MRKIMLPRPASSATKPPSSELWLNLEKIAVAEISSEDPQNPFENVLDENMRAGWRAAQPGPQQIRLQFDRPQSIRRIRLVIEEHTAERSQELALFASGPGFERRQIVRQQWNFSPGGSNTEVEDLSFDLHEVSVLEVEIDPGRHEEQQIATLQFLGIA